MHSGDNALNENDERETFNTLAPNRETSFTESKMSSRRSLLLTIVLLSFTFANKAFSDGVWQLARNGSWGDPSSWFGELPNDVGDIASFDAFSPALTATVRLDLPVVIGSLQDANPNRITILGIAPGELTFDADGSLQASLVTASDSGDLVLNTDVNLIDELLVSARNPSSEITIARSIRGNGDIVKTGSGLLKLDGENTSWQGALTVATGTVQVSLGNGLNSDVPHTVLDGATLQLDTAGAMPVSLEGGTLVLNGEDDPYSGELTIRDEGHLTTGSTGLGGGVHFAGPIRLVEGAHGVISLTAGALQIDGQISGSGKLEFRSDRWNINVGGSITHTGTVVINSPNYERVEFEVENSYDGQTVMFGGELLVRHPNGLGSPANGTLLQDGLLRVNAGSAEPIDVEGGILELYDFGASPDHFTGQISMRGGTLRANSSRTKFVDEPIVVQEGSRPTIESIASSDRESLRLVGGITGTGDVELSPRSLDIDGPLDLQGDIFITAGDNRVNSQNQFRHRIIVDNGSVIFNEDNYVESLHVIWGGVEVAPDKTLEVADLRLRAGQINGSLSGVGSLVKPGFGRMTFVDIGANFDGPVLIPEGVIRVGGPLGLGSSVGPTEVLGEQNAMLLIENTIRTMAEDIYLNNATGFADGGGLMAERGGTRELTGNIDLGDVGSTIGVTLGAGGFDLRGTLSGGALTVFTEGDGSYIRLSSGDHSYTGPTNVRRGQLVLGENGRLPATTSIFLNSGELLLENSAAGSHTDRVSDAVHIALRSGKVSLEGRDDAESSETLGTVELVSGHSEFRVFQEDHEHPSRLFIGELVRQPGSTVNFVRSDALGLGDNTNQLHLLSPPQLANGIIGGWATSDSDFVTVGPFGIQPLRDEDYETDFSNVTPATNFKQLEAITLVSDTSVNSWKTFTNETLDLGGNTLNILSGGLIGAKIANGTLTAGGDEPHELIVRKGGTISADISDNAGGAVSLIKTGSGRLELRGATTYTGTTIINEGELEAHNLPVGGDVIVNGGTLRLESDVELASFVMYDGFVGDLSVRADEIQLASGMIYSRFLGSGTIEKKSRGVLRYFSSLAEYQGNLRVDDGYWSVEDSFGLTTGENIVMPGGRIVINTRDVFGNVQLAGGQLTPSDPRSRLIGNVEVTDDSEILLIKGLDRTGLGGDLILEGNILVRAGKELTIAGEAEFTVEGEINLEPGAALIGNASIVGQVNIGDGARLEPGSSPGAISLSQVSWKSGGSYVWEINDAEGTTGAPLGLGWDVVNAGSLSIEAMPDNPFLIEVHGLNEDGELERVANFDETIGYEWPIVNASSISLLSAESLQLDVSGLIANMPELRPEAFSLLLGDNDLRLSYAPLVYVDFNGDGLPDVSDLDLLVGEIARDGGNADFDVNRDGFVDSADLSAWLSEAANQQGYASSFAPGDANLDGTVNASDLNALGIHYLEDVALWSSGDFTADGRVSAADLNVLGLHWQESITPAAAVPEPKGLLEMAVLLLCCVVGWQRGESAE